MCEDYIIYSFQKITVQSVEFANKEVISFYT